MYQYKRIELKNNEGFTQAEKLQAKGWKIILSGLDYILMEKKQSTKIVLHNRARVRELLNLVEGAGAVSVYLYGKEYGFVLHGQSFYGIIAD